MKFFILSDIHGSASAFERAAHAFEKEGADYLVVCGDYLNHGPRNPIPEGYDPQRAAKLLNGYKNRILAVRGNCDSEVDQMLLEFPCAGDYLVFFSGSRRFFVTHGHLWNEKNLPPLLPGDVFISGHTHVPVLEERDGRVFLNPGSPSIPKDGSEPGYAIIDDGAIVLKNLEGHELKRVTLSSL